MASTPGAGSFASDTQGVKQELAGDVQHLKQTAQEQVERKASEGQQQATRTAQAASAAMQTAAEQLRSNENAPAWLASAVSSAARQVNTLAEQLNGTSPGEIAQRSSQFAREHPGAFLTASAALGFAAARFLRAGAEYGHEQDRSVPPTSTFSSAGASATATPYGADLGAGSDTLPSETQGQANIVPPVPAYGDLA